MNRTDLRPLLRDDEPPAFEMLRAGGRPIVLVCDHASSRIPAALDALGLDARHLLDHIAWDIGAAAVARRLAARFEATAVLGGYSRLVVDLNRALDDASAFPEISDGILVPGNVGLSAGARAERATALHQPYHAAIERALAAAATPDLRPVLIAVHSFTPRLHGIERPWHVGVLWDKDTRLPLRLIEALRAENDVVVGDNEPYSGRHPADFTIDHHAEPAGIAHVGIEIRQDLVRDETGQTRWAERLAHALHGVLGDAALYAPRARAPARRAAPAAGEGMGASGFAWRTAARLGGRRGAPR